MSNLPLTFACGLYDRMLALYTREVVPEGIDLEFVAIDDPRKIFDQMVTHRAYDASEMSASEHVAMMAPGNSGLRRHSGVPLARVPPLVHLRQCDADQEAEGPRRQARGRAALHHDGGALYPRPAAGRIRRRPLDHPLGAGRDQSAGHARRSQGPAAAPAGFHRAEQQRQVVERAARRRHARRRYRDRGAGRHGAQPGSPSPHS